jgi:hypothetical protein
MKMEDSKPNPVETDVQFFPLTMCLMCGSNGVVFLVSVSSQEVNRIVFTSLQWIVEIMMCAKFCVAVQKCRYLSKVMGIL